MQDDCCVPHNINDLENTFDQNGLVANAVGESVKIELAIASKLHEPLSQRELEVLRLIVEGATNKEIADELVLTVNTVKRHISNIFGKLVLRNRAEAIARARELNLI